MGVLRGGLQVNMWDVVEKQFLSCGDFTNTEARVIKNIALPADALLRVLKDEVGVLYAALDILLLMIPLYKPIGKCLMAPNGVSQLDMAITDLQIKQLLQKLVICC